MFEADAAFPVRAVDLDRLTFGMDVAFPGCGDVSGRRVFDIVCKLCADSSGRVVLVAALELGLEASERVAFGAATAEMDKELFG